MKKILSFILAASMLMSMFSLVSCSEQTVNDVLDVVLDVVEALPGDESGDAETQPDTEDDTDEVSEQPPQESETEPEEVEAESEETDPGESETEPEETEECAAVIDENGVYDDRDNVALYLYTYGKLPKNYITKEEAEDLGWEGGSVERYAEGKCIGGSKFGNYEGLLPKKSGRRYYECDIGTLGKNSRGAERIVYSNDGLIYYTADHYESFELLYGED